MPTSSEDGTSAAAYGGGGAGGKFRKKPFRRAHLPTTPYDRPLTARISNPNNGTTNNPGLFAKLVVEPASKLISYGAHRFFSSVFRKRLPPPPQAPEVDFHFSDELQVAVSDCDVLKSGGGTSSQPLHSSADDGISELEQLLKQKTFSRSEVDHLTRLLRSRAAVEFSASVGLKRSGGEAPDFERHQPFASSPPEEHMQDEDRSLRFMSSPIINSRVIEDDMASPAELAKAYMGSRPSKISPSNLGTRNQARREDAGLLFNVPFGSKSPNMPLNMTTSVGLGDPKNGFITPKSRGRSAIYNMARTPYSRVHPHSIKKEIGSTNSCYGGLSIPSSSSSLVEQNEKIGAKSMTLKRRSSTLDDDPGSVGPMRRLRQKHNLSASKIPVIARGVESGSDLALVSSKQKLPLVVEHKNRVSKIVEHNEDESNPRTSYSCVSSKSTEVAARILQRLEKLTPTPKERSSESKLATGEKSTFRLTPSMLRGQALRSMEDADSSKLLLAVEDDYKLEDMSDVALHHDQDSTLKRPGKVDNGYKETVMVSGVLNPVVKNEFVESSTVPGPSRTADSVVKNSVAEHPQTKTAFRMSAHESFLVLDDDEHCYGPATRLLAEWRIPPDVRTLENKCSSDEETKLVKTTMQSEVKLPAVLSKTTESSSPSALMIGTGDDSISLSSPERKNAAIQSDVSQSVIATEKTNGTNDSVSLLRLRFQTVDNNPPLPCESVSVKPESKPEKSMSLLDAVSISNGSKVETPESDRGVYLNPLKTRDANGKPHTAPFASNGPLISRAPAVSFATTSHDAKQISTAISSPLTSSTSMASFSSIGTSTNTASLMSIASFGLTGFGNSTTSNGNSFQSNAAGSVFKFGGTVDASGALPAASTTNIPEVSDLKTKSEKEPNPGSSGGMHSAVASFGATNSGSSPSGLSTLISNSSANIFQSSLPATANKPSVSDFGLFLQSTSNPFSSSVSLPPLNMNGSMSLSTSLSHPQFNPNQSLGFSTAAASSETSMVKSGSGPTSSVGGFCASSTLSGDCTVSLNAPAAPGIFGFGLGSGSGSSSTSASAVGSTNGVTPPVVNYGGNSVTTSVTNNAISSSIGTSGIFNFGASSSSSTSAASNIFGSSWESLKPIGFSSTFTSSSPSTVFSFGVSASATAPANATSTVFNSQCGPLSSPMFPFSTSSPAFSLPSVSLNNQPILGNKPPSFTASPSGGDQMNAEDSMAEDPVQFSAPSTRIFGQPTISPSPPGFMFGSAAPPLTTPFQFGGQQNQIAPLNPSPFQASGSLEFNAGGSFSLGSGGADKSNRKFVKVSRSKNRK